MRASMFLGLVVSAAAAMSGLHAAAAETVLIRNATVHTMTARGVLEQSDVLISDGRIVAVGRGLEAPADAEIIDATGRTVTPGLFGGLTHLGVEEIGIEPTAADHTLRLGTMRPEFDIAPAFNPDATAVGVSRLGGITFAAVAPSAPAGWGGGGTIIAGQGAIARLDGKLVPERRALFVDLGGDASMLSGGSRAAQFMLLKQAFAEARTPERLLPADQTVLTPAGRQTLRTYLREGGLFVFDVDRASDIRQVLALAREEKLRVAIAGGAEAWRVAKELADAKVAVILDPLLNLPMDFDAVGATMENAARLHRAGVRIVFSLTGREAHNVRKVRQAAGNAVAHGLPHEAALAALTRNPAELFGLGDVMGTLEPGRAADLVLWSGDPLEVTTVAERVYIAGRAQPMRSRQTELRDRYFERLRAGQAR